MTSIYFIIPLSALIKVQGQYFHRTAKFRYLTLGERNISEKRNIFFFFNVKRLDLKTLFFLKGKNILIESIHPGLHWYLLFSVNVINGTEEAIVEKREKLGKRRTNLSTRSLQSRKDIRNCGKSIEVKHKKIENVFCMYGIIKYF